MKIEFLVPLSDGNAVIISAKTEAPGDRVRYIECASVEDARNILTKLLTSLNKIHVDE